MKKKQDFICLVALLCVSTASISQEKPGHYIASFQVLPELGVQQRYDNNILSSDNGVENSYITIVAPGIKISADRSNSQYSLAYKGELAKYSSSEADNYLDQHIQADLLMDFSTRNHLKTRAKYLFLHQDRGTGFTQGEGETINNPDEYNIRQVGASYIFGSDKSLNRVELDFDFLVERFENRPEVFYLGNRNYIAIKAAYYRLIRANTSLLLEAQYTEIDYRVETEKVTLDSMEKRVFVGTTWEVTAITRGVAKFGILSKDFVDSGRNDYSGYSWEIGAFWKPLSYSKFDMKMLGTAEEAEGKGDFKESISGLGNWHHDWNRQLSTGLKAMVEKSTYRPLGQSEGIWSLSLRFDYKMRSWLNFGAGIAHYERLSHLKGHDYNRDLFNIDLLVSI